MSQSLNSLHSVELSQAAVEAWQGPSAAQVVHALHTSGSSGEGIVPSSHSSTSRQLSKDAQLVGHSQNWQFCAISKIDAPSGSELTQPSTHMSKSPPVSPHALRHSLKAVQAEEPSHRSVSLLQGSVAAQPRHALHAVLSPPLPVPSSQTKASPPMPPLPPLPPVPAVPPVPAPPPEPPVPPLGTTSVHATALRTRRADRMKRDMRPIVQALDGAVTNWSPVPEGDRSTLGFPAVP